LRISISAFDFLADDFAERAIMGLRRDFHAPQARFAARGKAKRILTAIIRRLAAMYQALPDELTLGRCQRRFVAAYCAA